MMQWWMFVVGNEEGHRQREKNRSAKTILNAWLERGYWGLKASADHRKHLRDGDVACFYLAETGVVAKAQITGPASRILTEDERPFGMQYVSEPLYCIPLSQIHPLGPFDTAAVYKELDTYHKSPMNFGLFVRTDGARKIISARDFYLLTHDRSNNAARVGGNLEGTK